LLAISDITNRHWQTLLILNKK